METEKRGFYCKIFDVNSGKIKFYGWKKPGLILAVGATEKMITYKNKTEYENSKDGE